MPKIIKNRPKLHKKPLLLASLIFALLLASIFTVVYENVNHQIIATHASGNNYDTTILADGPIAYWSMNQPGTAEKDLTGNGHNGTYKGGTPTLASLPDGEQAVDFNGTNEYMTVPSSSSFSISTTHQLTWEAWIRPDVLQFPKESNDGYIAWMGKCQNYSPSCEWEARMYSSVTPQNRCNRLSAYVFNPKAGLGSGADWQPTCNLLKSGQWLHVVAEYQTLTQPTGCKGPQIGGINIWVNGVEWNQSYHLQTGCLSQYGITPQAGNSPLNIGTMAFDTWFPGAVGKVAIYNKLLTQTQITNHFITMTAAAPSGSCGSTCTIPVPTQNKNIGTNTAATQIPLVPTSTSKPTSIPAQTIVKTQPTSTSSNGLAVTQKITSSWNNGYCAVLSIKNTTTTPIRWSTSIIVNGKVTSLWDADWQQNKSIVTLSGKSYDKTIAAGQTLTSLGYCARYYK